MLRKLVIGVVIANLMLVLGGVITSNKSGELRFAEAQQNSTGPITVSAVVPEFLELNAKLYKMKADGSDIDWDAGTQTTINFGTLKEVTNPDGSFAYLASNTTYAMVMYPVSSGRPYFITQIGTPLTGPGTPIDVAFVVSPDYQGKDILGGVQQGTCPGALGAPKSAAIGTNTIYTSDAQGKTKAIRAYLAVTGPDKNKEIANYSKGYDTSGNPVGTKQYYYDGNNSSNPGPWKPVTKEQKPGSYSGSVTFTLNLS